MMTIYFVDGEIYEPTIQQAEDATDHGMENSARLLALYISDTGMAGKISASYAVYEAALAILEARP